jgi:hypothetical protein
MIDYRLDDLGWFEFEQLIQTLAKVRLGFGIELPMWPAGQQTTLQSRSVHFESESNSLREELPGEPDSDDSEYERSSSEDLNIDDLFRDL